MSDLHSSTTILIADVIGYPVHKNMLGTVWMHQSGTAGNNLN